ncbi:hypothetical protein [Microbaculum marinum]|uniref:Antifreeze protein n=1 Tax=Microbaculum marinum TaxID=1764581 RepID=A0AAW9S2N4_9HYPH
MTPSIMSLFMNSAFLAMEAQQVVWLRMMRVAAGGASADRELSRMATEKMQAAIQLGTAATLAAVGGNSSERIAANAIRGYRSRVRANRRRLTK